MRSRGYLLISILFILQAVVFDWLNEPKIEQLCFAINASGNLQGFNFFPTNAKGKICYFIRKEQTVLTPENMREVKKII
jgi:hypothetical protein